MDRSSPSVAQGASDVSGVLTPRTAEIAADVYGLIVREIPPLRSDTRILSLLDASVAENVATMLHVLQHDIDLEKVRAPAAAQEYARRLAQRGVPVAALLRAYRIGSARFQDWCLEELGRSTDDASMVSAVGLRIADITARYIDRVSEEVVSAYEAEKENWLRNLSATRAARVRALLAGERVDVEASEAILRYRLRQHHVGVVCWADEAEGEAGTLARMEQATVELARSAGCAGRPLFLPQDELSARAWLPLGGRDVLPILAAGRRPHPDEAGIRFALGAAGAGVTGFRRSHQQALAAHAVALAAGPAGQVITSFADVAPLALMSGSTELLRAWVAETLGSLADDDDHKSTLRDTLRVFLAEGGSFKATAERLTLHKNTVQYRVRKAEESIGGPVGQGRLQVELALLACHWLGASVLRPAAAPPS
jgi:PucR C-terminal helix-turn-helix domain/GGDEF-like domain